jgi:CRP/FNR family transcriptional regulator
VLSTVDKVLFLLRSPVTAEATTDALARLALVAQELEVEKGTRLFTVGEEPDALYVVLDGAVRIEGIEVPSRLVGPGELVGALALFSPGPHLATAQTVVATHLLRVDRADLYDLLDEDGEFARALFSGLVAALRSVSPAALIA